MEVDKLYLLRKGGVIKEIPAYSDYLSELLIQGNMGDSGLGLMVEKSTAIINGLKVIDFTKDQVISQ